MPDESSPLLPRHQQQPVGQNEPVRRRTRFEIPEDYDNNELIRHRSRLSSYSVVNIPDYLKKEGAGETEHVEQADGEDGPVDDAEVDSQPDSKYKNISTFRFWLVFLTIMTGTW